MSPNTPSEFNAQPALPASAGLADAAFVLTLARRQAKRLGLDAPRMLHRMPDRAACFAAGHVEWPVERCWMESEPWIIARMALDLRGAILAATGTEPGDAAHSFATTDLIEMGWTQDHVRRFAAVALASAMADVASSRDAAHQRQFSGFSTQALSLAPLLGAVALGLCGAIGIAATALATLI
jgi:hypothetical protein